MKKISLLFAFGVLTVSGFAQTLFTYGNNTVDKSEFLRAYNKNKTPVENKEKALREYLDLYIKFKLKVQAGKDLKLDTMPQLKYDAQSFRSQIENSYLNNESALNGLLTEAFNRSQKDLHVLHFFAPVDENTDTIKPFKAITGVYKALSAGQSDYEKIAAAEEGAVRQSDLGFITAFTLPYDYENLIYNLKMNQAGKPYRSKNGWHVFKLIGERKAMGKWKIAQILISIPPGTSEEDKLQYKKKADSVYSLLVNGEDFGKLARNVSDDKITYGNRGEMAEFGAGKFDQSFESEILKLTKNDEISKPFLTTYGYHIVKRLAQSPISADKNDPALQFELKQKIQQDSRVNIARDMFVQEVLKQLGYKKLKSVSEKDLFRFADTVIARPDSKTSDLKLYPISNKIIATFTKSSITVKDWLDFIRNYKGTGELYQGENNAALFDKFVSSYSMDFYKTNLQDYNDDFRYQMEEFRDGNILFEIMEKNIWEKASGDEESLKKYYDANKAKYLWSASADIILFSSTDMTFANNARAAIIKGEDWQKIMTGSNYNVQADSGRFELSQIPISVPASMLAGSVSEPSKNNFDENIIFVKIIRRYEAGAQRTFEEARGLVINDYQNQLEDKWLSDLKKKYPVKVNEKVFEQMLK